MSQNDLSIANQGFASFRSDLNSALQALGSTNSGTSAPSTTYANQLFYDTTNNILKIRNEDNDAFINLITLDQTNDKAKFDLDGTELILDADGDTSITADTDDQIDIKIAGSDNLRIKANEIENVSGDFTLDVVGDITLDANGQQIYFAKNGTTFGQFGTESTPSTFTIESTVSDGDIAFKGSEGGSGITAMTIDMSAGGKVGIGTTSPNAKLSVSGTGTVDLGIGSTNAGGAYLYLDGDSNGDFSGSDYSYIGHDTSGQLLIHQDSPSGSDNILFRTNATERMRIDSDGHVGIGTTDPQTGLHVEASDGSVNGTIRLTASGVASSGMAMDANGLNFGTDTGGFLFKTGATANDPSDTGTERMRISASGSLFLGNNAAGAVTPSASQTGTEFAVGNFPYILNSVNDASTRYHHQFFNSNGSVGIISTNGSNTTYATSSDYRLKENVNYDWDGTTELKKLKPCKFNFKADNTTTIQGFLAHEVAEVVPNAVVGDKDEMKALSYYEEGDTLPTGKKVGDVKERSETEIAVQSLDNSYLVPLLVKTIQELEARIATLEAK